MQPKDQHPLSTSESLKQFCFLCYQTFEGSLIFLPSHVITRHVCECTYNCCPTGRSSHVVEHDVFGGIVQFFPPEHAVVEGHSHVLVDKLKDHSCHFYIHIRFKKQVMVYQVWPLTQFFMFPFCKISLICLEGKSMTPHRGNTILFRSSQQLP